ncbi:MAG: fibronectin type III domain-containing protein [Deltaproteobacteria bacterium]|nr:fibronectin type III domain-containing protein [Deltaproteobacteria bacterium]
MCIKRSINAVAILFFILTAIAGPANAGDLSLTWDPNNEPTLAGYKLYYKAGTSGPPYDGADSFQGPSPIDVGNTTSFTLTGLSDRENYYFTVTAYDTEGRESGYSNEVATLTVSIANRPPVADAGPDQTVEEGSMATLSGLNSVDQDDGIATYEWQQISGPVVVLANPSAVATSFVAPDVSADGSVLGFQLTVTDRGGNRASDQCLVNVTWLNIPPIADAGHEQVVYANEIVTLDGSASYDIDGVITSYEWTQAEGTPVELAYPWSAQAAFTASSPGPEGESLTFTLTVTDRYGLQDTDTCVVSVPGLTNEPPLAEAGPDQTASEGDTVLLDGSGSSDADGGIASYQWSQAEGPPAALDNPGAIETRFTAPTVSYDGEPLIFQLTVTDQSGSKSSDKCNVAVRKPSIDVVDTFTDLTGEWLSLSRFLKGKSVWIKGKFLVNNLGNQKVDSVSVRFYLSFDCVLDSEDTMVANSIAKNITADGGVTVALEFKDKLLGTDYPAYIIAEIDCGNVIPESREDNNIIIISSEP